MVTAVPGGAANQAFFRVPAAGRVALTENTMRPIAPLQHPATPRQSNFRRRRLFEPHCHAVNALPVLYSFRRCPYAMRARLALLSSATACELREVVLRDKPAALLAASPKGTVPVLVLPEGAVLEQSLDIMLWALARRDPQHWLPADAAQRQQALQQITACDTDFKPQLDRYKYPNRFGLGAIDGPRDQGCRYLGDLERQLQATAYLGGMAWGLADAAIAPFVRQWAHTAPTWFAQQPWPALQRWLHGFETSAAFATVMQPFGPWVAGSPAIVWPALA